MLWKYILFFLFNYLIVIPLKGQVQEFAKPVRNAILLSGNFELHIFIPVLISGPVVWLAGR